MKNNIYDFLIIGSGLSGLYSAYHASKLGKVCILSKSILKNSSSFLAQGGIAAALGKDDSTKIHFDDTMRVGKGLCNPQAVKILVEEGKKEIENLISAGMMFDHTNEGIELGLEGGHSRRRIVHTDGSATGRALVNFLLGFIRENPAVNLFENKFVYELITKGNACCGIKYFDEEENKAGIIFAKNIIIATGGFSGIFSRTTNPETSNGDGIALAYNAGAIIENLEFVQFHPTVLSAKNLPPFLLSEALRGEGALIVDENENRILDMTNKTELSPRDELCRFIFDWMKINNENNVYLKLSHLDLQKLHKRFSYVFDELKKWNIDVEKNLIPISPAAHYTIGGIKTGLNGETNINNLYAVGECASSGIHGANRLASNSLLECLVFSKRAVQNAKENILPASEIKDEKLLFLLNDELNKKYYENFREIVANSLWNHAGIKRNGDQIKKVNELLKESSEKYTINKNHISALKIEQLLLVSSLLLESILLRKESRGCHFREDYKDEYPGLNFNILLQKGFTPTLENLNKD